MVLWEPSLAGDGSPREGNPLLSDLSVDVRASGDVKRWEMPRERSRWSFSVDCRSVLFRRHGVSGNITVRDLDLGATVDDVWRLGAVASGLILFSGIALPVDTPLFVSTLHGNEWRRRRAADGTDLRSLGLDEVTSELDWRIFFGRSC